MNGGRFKTVAIIFLTAVFGLPCEQALAAYCPASGGCDEYIYDVYFSTRHYTHTDCSNYTDTTSTLNPPTFLSVGSTPKGLEPSTFGSTVRTRAL